MATILKLNASMRREPSYGRRILNEFVRRLNTSHHMILHRDLADGVPLINDAWIDANFTKAPERTAQQRSLLSLSDALVDELRVSDIFLMAVPIYNFHFPAAFKAWIDLIARPRETFRYTDNGPIGLLENKRALVVITSGGTQLGSKLDFMTDYLKHILSFIGVKDVTIVDCSGGNKSEELLEQAIEQMLKVVNC